MDFKKSQLKIAFYKIHIHLQVSSRHPACLLGFSSLGLHHTGYVFSRAGGWSRPRGSLSMSIFHTFRSHSWLFGSGVSPAWSFGLFNDLFGLTADRWKHKVSKEVRESSHTKTGSSDSFIHKAGELHSLSGEKIFHPGTMSTITFCITDNLKVSLTCYISKNEVLRHNAGGIVEKPVNDIKNFTQKSPNFLIHFPKITIFPFKN